MGLLSMTVVGPATHSESAALWLEVPSRARLGETVLLKLRVKNISDQPLPFGGFGRPDRAVYDFIITQPDGKEVWRLWRPATAKPAALMREPLKPSEEREYTAEWNQLDNHENAVPPGTYLVYGILDTEGPDLKTDAKELVLLP